jgi:hypothetical protein
MKKLLYLLLFIPFGVSGQTASQAIVTTPANSGLGTPLKTAIEYIKTDFVAVQDSFGHIYRESQTDYQISKQIHDTVTTAYDLSDYAFLISNANTTGNAVTLDWVLSHIGGGGGSSTAMYELKGIVGTTAGIPTNGDSLVINTGFIAHPRIQVYRDGVMQWPNVGLAHNTGTTTDAFVFNSTTGTVIVRPVFATGEKLIIHASDAAFWNDLVAEGGSGGGGGGGGSSLLTNLAAYFKLDEVSGTQVTDQVGNVAYAVTSGTVNQTGKIGKGVAIDGTTQGIESNYYAAVQPSGAFSVGCWVNLDVLPGTKLNDYYIFGMPQGTAPYNAHNIQIRQSDNKVVFTVTNTSATEFTVVSSGALSASTWYNIVAVCAGAGSPLKLYINGADVSASAGTPTGTIYTSPSAGLAFGNSYDGGGHSMDGTIDECALWIGTALSGALVTEWYSGGVGKTYPF